MPDSALAAQIVTMSDLDLLDTAAELHDLHTIRKSTGYQVSDVEEAHGLVAAEMRKRNLMYEPLAKETANDSDPKEESRDTGDGDHGFVPVRNICRVCKQPAEAHKSFSKGFAPAAGQTPKPAEQSGATPSVPAGGDSDGTTPTSPSGAAPGPDSVAGGGGGQETGAAKTDPDDYSVEDRQKMAEEGIAMPDGSFPIANEANLHRAVRLVGQANDPQAAMNHIIERAKAMGMIHALPPAWNVPDVGMEPTGPAVGPGAHGMAPGAKPGGGGAAGGAPKPGGGMMKRLAKALASAMGASFDEDTFAKALDDVELDAEFDYAVIQKNAEERYTLGPVYMPNRLDAHGEWATAEDLHKSIWQYVEDTREDPTVYLQHSDQPAGRWMEVMAWPQEVSAKMTKSIDGVRKEMDTTFPAGTVYMGVCWEPWAWEEVKKGKLTGFSMGGFAQRVEADVN